MMMMNIISFFLKFDHTTKQYMQKPESVLENETHKILWDFDIQTDHLNLPRRQDLVLIKKQPPQKTLPKTCDLVDFAVPVDQ